MALRSNMKQVLSHRASGHSRPNDLASSTTNVTFSFENDEARADTGTIKAEPVSGASPIPTRVNQMSVRILLERYRYGFGSLSSYCHGRRVSLGQAMRLSTL